MDGIRMKDIVNEAIFFDMSYDQNNDNNPEHDSHTGISRLSDSKYCVRWCKGCSVHPRFPEMPVKNIRLNSIAINSTTGCLLQDAEHIEMNNVRLSFSEWSGVLP